MTEPKWARVHYPPIDFQDAYYYAAPKASKEEAPASLDEVDPKLLKTYEKLGIPLSEQKMLTGVAVDAVFNSVSVATTFKAKLEEVGVIFCPISEALAKHPDLVRKYLGSVVPDTDNFYATLNSAVFSDGSFVYIPEGVRCPMELSTYFQINASKTGQFERTLIIADKNSYVSYLEGCTAPMRDENQLHAAVVELVALEGAEIKYSTVQNWYPGDENGKGGRTPEQRLRLQGAPAAVPILRQPSIYRRPVQPENAGDHPPGLSPSRTLRTARSRNASSV